ncbi:30S ribosomal protein S1 [bacterium]|nr:30S ribosomal protein S1 [bacterium]
MSETNTTNNQTKDPLTRKLHDEENANSYKEDGMTFEEMFEQSLGDEGSPTHEVRTGEVREGKVISVGADKVLVDIGYKAEGEVDLSEFKAPDGTHDVKVGDTFSVVVARLENEHGLLTLSKDRADLMKAWDEIAEACERGDILEGVVTAVVKGGLQVNIGVKAFLPGSQLDTRPIKDLDQFVGKTLKFKVIKFNQKRGNIVLSRRAVMEVERDQLKSATLKQLKVGAVVRGTIKNVTDYGAFVDLGGVDGLLHITDMSWGRIKHPSEAITAGDEINVLVLKYDAEKERVSLGLKQILPDPWATVEDRFVVGQRVKGKVVSLTDYGAFIEVEAGVEGLIHVSEMSWTQRVKDPRKILDASEEVEAVILDIDLDSRRMSLGLKQISPNPWDTLEFKYPTGTKIKGVIKNLTDFGIFVEIEEGIDGLVHVSDLSWDNKVTNPAQEFEKGQEVEAMVMSIDKANERISLSVKNLSRDPWSSFIDANPAGTAVDGVVSKLANFGAFVELDEGVEGMVHISELSEDRIMHPEQVVKVGDKIKVEITNIDNRERKISLSVKALGRREEQENIDTYTKSQGTGRSSLADTLDPAIAAKLGLLGGDASKADSSNVGKSDDGSSEDS